MDFGHLEGNHLNLSFEQFKKKKSQIEESRRGRLIKLHFGFDGKATDSTAHHERLFEQMRDYLLPYGVISNGLQLKRAYFSWAWLLKDGVYIPKTIQNRLLHLKVQINNRPLSKSEEKHIAIQSMAQIIGYLNEHFNAKKIKEVIARFLPMAPTILYLNSLKSVRDYRKNQKEFSDFHRKKLIFQTN